MGKNKTLYLWGETVQRIDILYQKQRRPEGSGTMFLSTERKVLSTMESISGKTVHQE